MSKVKLLISALPAMGKTTLLQTLEDVLVVARDGKKYPFPQAHVNVPDFTSSDEFIDLVVDKVESYEAKMGDPPKIVAIDSFSKIVLDVEAYVLEQVSSFPYGKVNTEIKRIVDFIETDLAGSFDVVLISHAMYSEDLSGYSLVNAGGSYGKKGGILSEVDEAIFLEFKANKRIIHFRNPKMASRTTVAALPDKMSADDFNLMSHIEMLRKKQSKAASWSL